MGDLVLCTKYFLYTLLARGIGIYLPRPGRLEGLRKSQRLVLLKFLKQLAGDTLKHCLIEDERGACMCVTVGLLPLALAALALRLARRLAVRQGQADEAQGQEHDGDEFARA